jgi:hypothetical protein
MMTNEQLKGLSEQERSAWLDSMNEDERAIAFSAVGRRYTLVFISLVKNILAEELPAEYRLRFLQWLDRRNEPWESPQIIAAIEPMCEDGYQLLRETMKLGPKKYLDVIASWEVFNAFVVLNPSLLTAIKMGAGYYSPARQPEAARALEILQ